MELICPKCASKGRLDDAKIPETGATVRCPKCQGRMLVRRSGEVDMLTEAQPADNQAGSPDSRSCPGCGKELAPGAKFCMYCGKDLTGTQAQGSPQTAGQTTSAFPGVQTGFPGPTPGTTAPMPPFHYAGFWIRFLAKIIDGVVLWLVYMALTMVFSMFFFSHSSPYSGFGAIGAFIAYMGFLLVLEMVISLVYAVYFVGKFGATPGKMVCRLKVVQPDGSTVSYPRALGRFFAEGLSALILFIGYIMAGFDRQKRSLHDHICATRVIRQS